MVDPNEDEEPMGVVDGVSIFYIFAGIPAIWGFLALLFGAVRLWNIPA
jgi:hypothetical protein